MATTVPIKHTPSGIMKKGFYGFSWTICFLAGLSFCFAVNSLSAPCILLFTIVTLGFWQLIVCFSL